MMPGCTSVSASASAMSKRSVRSWNHSDVQAIRKRCRKLGRQDANQPHVRNGVVGARHERVMTGAVRSLVRPAKRWIHVVSRASARVIAGRMVVSRRANIDLPAPGGPGGGRCGQNACIVFSFTTASEDADG